MPLNIPMPQLPGQALMSGINTGGQLFSRMMQAQNQQKMNQLRPSGDVANSAYISQLEAKLGANHPAVLEAKRAHEMALAGHQSLMDTRDILNATAGIRATSTMGKLIYEGRGKGAVEIVNNALANRNNNKSAPQHSQQNNIQGASNPPPNAQYKLDEQYYDAQGEPVYDKNPRTEEEKKAYEGAIAKQTSDPETRSKYLSAVNLDKTRKSINVDDLTRYSGLIGTGKYLAESAKAMAGNPSEEYLAHQSAVNSASLMADQMRAFYKDSIQPSAMDRLRQLSNPSTWYKDPKVAKTQWEQLNKILDQETETYKNAGTSPIKLNKIDFKNGKFVAENNQSNKNKSNNEEDQILNAASQQLIHVMPDVTPKKIKQAAIEEGISIDDAINELMQIRDSILEKQNGRT